MFLDDFDEKNTIIIKMNRKAIYLLLFIFLVIVAGFAILNFIKSQTKRNAEHKIASEIIKDDKYWRQYGEKVFFKMKQAALVENVLIGESGKEFQNDANMALSYFKKAKELNGSLENWSALAKFQDFLTPYIVENSAEAVTSYLYIIKTFPKNNDIIRATVRLLIINSDKALLLDKKQDAQNGILIANELVKNLKQDDPINLYGAYYGALLARREKNFSSAISTLEKIKFFLNNEPDLYFELGTAYMQNNQFEKAKINLEIASKLSKIYQKNSEIFLRIIDNKLKQTTSTKK